MRVRVIAQFRDLRLAGERGFVQLLHVGQMNLEVEPFHVDAPADYRVEHETVVRTRRETQRQPHSPSMIRIVACVSAPTASGIRHAARFRRSTMFDTARTCAKRTPFTRQADMNAAPSMLSTCGENRSTRV